MTAQLIGLGGRLRSGKDTVADHLVAKHGFVKFGMSDALHEAMMAVDPIIEAELYHPAIRYREAIEAIGYVRTKEQYPEARRLLQRLGTEVGREMIGENVWVDIAARKVDEHLKAGRGVALAGVRFPNELRLIRQFAGKAVWVERPSQEESTIPPHASESGVNGDDFDLTLLNNSSLSSLYAAVDGLVF